MAAEVSQSESQKCIFRGSEKGGDILIFHSQDIVKIKERKEKEAQTNPRRCDYVIIKPANQNGAVVF